MSFLRTVKSKVFGGAVSDLTIQEANVGDELAAAGIAFARVMEQVGLAVAATQKELDKNGATIAEEMCKADVEMIRARETIYNDDGKIVDLKIVTGTGKLIELASPVFYEHKYVALQGEFTAKELATSTQSKVTQAGVSAKAAIGRSGGGRGRRNRTALTGSASASASASFSDVTSGTTFDSSIGTMRMMELLAPKEATAIPKPPLILVGPKVVITPVGGPITDASGNRRANITITVTDRDGAVNPGRILSIDTDGIDWVIVDSTNPVPSPGDEGAPKTDADGKLKITLQRTMTPGAPPLEGKQAAVTVRLGLVTTTAAIPV